MSPELVFDQGYHLRGTPLWMDAETPRELCFVSSGRMRPLARHGRILATPATARFCRLQAGQDLALMATFNRPFVLGTLRLELMPSGSMLGAAQLCVDTSDGRVVYAGCLGALSGLATAHAPQLKRCDVLALHLPQTPVATAAAARAGREAMLARVTDGRLTGRTSVVLVEPLGLAQELLAWFQAAGLRVRAHRSIAEHARDYRKLDVLAASALSMPSRVREDDDGDEADVVLFPRLLATSPLLQRLRPAQLLLPVAAEQDEPRPPAGATLVSGVSTAASLEELQAYAEACGASRVYVTGRGAAAAARALTAAGRPVVELRTPGQRRLFGELNPTE